MLSIIKNILYRGLLILHASAIGMCIFLFSFVVYMENFSDSARDKRIYVIYNKLWAATGQAQMRIPLIISEENIENAYDDGYKIVLYRGLINTASDNELTLVLGHEIAHKTLDHFIYDPEKSSVELLQGLEANADKMGAIYALKVGANVCTGREVFKRWKEEIGNPLGQRHPDFSYRYDELNIGCD